MRNLVQSMKPMLGVINQVLPHSSILLVMESTSHYFTMESSQAPSLLTESDLTIQDRLHTKNFAKGTYTRLVKSIDSRLKQIQDKQISPRQTTYGTIPFKKVRLLYENMIKAVVLPGIETVTSQKLTTTWKNFLSECADQGVFDNQGTFY
jgi:hypothetical protein